MISIIDPQKNIAALWNSSTINKDETYRLMRYVVRVNHNNEVLLCNVVTGQVVVLEQKEIEAIEKLPALYSRELEQLVFDHFLVAEHYDEHQQVVQMRNILHKIATNKGLQFNVIKDYTILPTTACNARCYYCFEHGISSATMTEKTANDVIGFIAGHVGEDRKISIRWFGGEPTVAASRIDQICQGLLNANIEFSSTMTTNGFLFNQEMVKTAKDLWNLREVMISVDGAEDNYNKIKSYVAAAGESPYKRVLRNVGLLINEGIHVNLRMNFDINNYMDFPKLCDEVNQMYHGNRFLKIYAFPIIGEYPDRSGAVHHGSVEWFDEKTAELNSAARDAGYFHRSQARFAPSMFYTTCKAGDPSTAVITPQGELSRCVGCFSREEWIVGDVIKGITNPQIYQLWDQFAEPDGCAECALFPKCILLEACPGKNRCFRKETFRQFEDYVKMSYDSLEADDFRKEGYWYELTRTQN